MAKGPGGTRTSTSANPRGNGGSTLRSVHDRIMEARDAIISLEAQRDQLRQNGGSREDIARLTQEIDDRRTALRVAEREFAKLPNEPINPEDDWTRELNLGQEQQSTKRRINASWSQFNGRLSTLDRQVKGLSLVQEFSLEPAERGDDNGGYYLAYSSYRDRYMIRRREGGRTTTIAESPAIDDIVRQAKKRGLLPVGVRRAPGTTGR